MKVFFIIFLCCLIGYFIFWGILTYDQPIARDWKLPINTVDRQNLGTLFFEHDAHFKALRAAFDNIKQHYHTGLDIRSGRIDFAGEPVYAIATGKVIAIEDPPPQRRITIQHLLPNGKKIWSVYIHIIEETVAIGEIVDSETMIARTMNAAELEVYGSEYNHVHLEIMKKLPPPASAYYQRKTFTCYTEQEVDKYYYDPELFLINHF